MASPTLQSRASTRTGTPASGWVQKAGSFTASRTNVSWLPQLEANYLPSLFGPYAKIDSVVSGLQVTEAGWSGGERKRIAAGLHDSLGQNLLIIKNRALLGLQRRLENGEAQTQLEEISTVSSQALDEVREIAYDLHPYQIDRLGLTKAVQAMLRKVASASDIEFAMDIDNIDGFFPKDSEINIYRIVQESIHNILKHAEARHASVAIKRDARSVQISITDTARAFRSTPGRQREPGSGCWGSRNERACSVVNRLFTPRLGRAQP
jgi:signal transduction histidine kinase